MKKQRLFWFPILLICVSLACSFPGLETAPGANGVHTVSVTPHISTGSFSAKVDGQVNGDNEKLRCYVSGSKGDVLPSETIKHGFVQSNEAFLFVREFTFTYTVPGTHSLVCLINNKNSTADSDDFVVVAAGDQPPAPSGNSPKIDPSQLTHGDLRFNMDEATPNTAGVKPGHGCWPAIYYDDGGGYLKLTTDGTIEGYCSWTSPSKVNLQVTWNDKGTLTGTYNLDTGAVTFHLKTQTDYPGKMNVTVTEIFDGTGSFTSPTHAEGNAKFNSKCQSNGSTPYCGPNNNGGENAYWDVSGTVPWTLDFTP